LLPIFFYLIILIYSKLQPLKFYKVMEAINLYTSEYTGERLEKSTQPLSEKAFQMALFIDIAYLKVISEDVCRKPPTKHLLFVCI